MTVPSQATMKAALRAYVDRTNAGDAAGLVALFSADATIEDPVGTPLKHAGDFAAWFGDSVAFGARITPVTEMRGSHGNAAALVFEVQFTPPGGPPTRIRSLDVCTFDAEARITSLKAYWGPDDVEITG
jgi:steroid Delta-isomerase